MKKILLRSLMFAVFIGVVVWAASLLFHFSFSEWGFIIGFGLSVFLYFFNSSGGPLSSGANFEASQAGWKIQSDNEFKVNVGAFFYGSLLFTIASLVMTVIVYA